MPASPPYSMVIVEATVKYVTPQGEVSTSDQLLRDALEEI